MAESVDLAVWSDPGLRAALARRDLPTVYLGLVALGYTQRQISELTGQRQSEVSAIMNGRPVQSYDLLVRIASGLGVPRGWLGLAFTDEAGGRPSSAYPGDAEPRAGEVTDDVRRRVFLAAATAAVFGRPVLGDLVDLPDTAEATPLPARLGVGDVRALRDLTERWRALGRTYGGMVEVVSPAARRADRLQQVGGPGDVGRELRSALAELHLLAGYTAYDTNAADLARWHYTRALHHAGAADDRETVVSVVQHAALTDREGGAPNDALKLYQLAQGYLAAPTSEAWVPAKCAWLAIQSASALALMGNAEATQRELARAADTRHVADAFERADMDHVRAQAHLDLGQLDLAEQYAARSVATWGPSDRRDGVLARITRATAHVLAGDSQATRLAGDAISHAAELRSLRARTKLAPLERALTTRTDTAFSDLAQQARAIRTATT